MNFDVSTIDNITKNMTPREMVEACVDIAHYSFSNNLVLEKKDVPSVIEYCYALIDKIESQIDSFPRIDPVLLESRNTIRNLRRFIIEATDFYVEEGSLP